MVKDREAWSAAVHGVEKSKIRLSDWTTKSHLKSLKVTCGYWLITELIKAYCPKNADGFYDGVILDPFHGSGTLGVCCEKLNKQGHKIKWIGIELEKKWSDICNERINKIGDEL